MNRVADPVSAPSSYSEFFSEYYDYVKALLIKQGLSDVEDTAMSIILRFYERDFLNEFDPSLKFVRDGKVYNARFKSFLNKFVLTYAMSHRDRQYRTRHREPVSLDAPLSAGEGEGTFIDVLGGVTDNYEAMEFSRLVEECRRRLAEVPLRGRRNLLLLFNMALDQVCTYGRVYRADLAAAYGVSDTVIGSMLRDMRPYIDQALAACE